uniref:uncharacterized protein LOC122582972 n=1 Tax=Erigeron canadensis TaxID=72917 RepID=UPI001CB93106|nr:uncharacterized protein LOC122582972 [Erigeron canadensis]
MTSLIMLLFSDWTIISIRESPDIDQLQYSWKTTFYTALLKLRTEGIQRKDTSKYDLPIIEEQILESRNRKAGWLKRRWSESVSTYNLIHYCLHPHWTKVICEKLHLDSDFLDSLVHVQHKAFTPHLKNLIFGELQLKTEFVDSRETSEEIGSARGDWVLRVEAGWSSLLKYVVDVDYDQSLILWHIATELCYNNELYEEYKLKRCKRNTFPDHREMSKLLSDYMLYLLIMHPSLMSEVAGGIAQIRFQDTCAEARRFFDERNVKELTPLQEFTKEGWEKHIDLIQVKACDEILKVPTKGVMPATIKGHLSKSLLFDSCILAKELMQIQQEKNLNKWLIMSKVWVELLCYGARHSRANVHAAQVSNGGELISIVWLLMNHFGVGEQFQINEGQPRAKLIVGK